MAGYKWCCAQTDESKHGENSCAKIMEMMQNCCPGKECGEAGCWGMMQKMMVRNCCPEQENKSG